VTFLWTLAW